MRALLLCLLIAGCAFDPAGKCSTDSECSSGLRCSAGVCAACAASSDCHSWESCGTTGLCTALAGRCNSSSDCESFQQCDGNNTCILQTGRCASPADCSAIETCGADNLCALQAGRCRNDGDCRQLAATCDSTSTCSVAAAGDVILNGTLLQGLCAPAISRLSDPAHPQLGSDCNWIPIAGAAFLQANGAIVYEYGQFQTEVHSFVPDPYTFQPDGGVNYPAKPNANDPLLVNSSRDVCPNLDNNASPGWAFQGGTGTKIFWGCPHFGLEQGTFDWYDANNALQFTGPAILAWNDDDVRYLATNKLMDASGTLTPINGLRADSQVIAGPRSHLHGFWVAYQDVFTTQDRFLYDVSNAGVATLVGTYAANPSPIFENPVLDSTGVLYGFGRIQADDIAYEDEVVRLPLAPEVATIPYSEANSPHGKAGSFYTYVHISSLITSP
jgi:hypothetical protein